MTRLRRLTRRWVFLFWAAAQVSSLAVVLQANCCTTHEPAEQAQTPPCHDDAPAVEPQEGEHCPMRGAGGAPCPMHAAESDHAEHAPATPSTESQEDCTMSGACSVSATFATLAIPAVLPGASSVAAPALEAVAPAKGLEARGPSRRPSPDPHPPRT